MAVPDVRFTFAVDLAGGKVVVGAVGDEMPETPSGDIRRSVIRMVRDGLAAGAVTGDPVIARLPIDGTIAIAYMLAGPTGAHRRGDAAAAYGYAFDVGVGGSGRIPGGAGVSCALPPTGSAALPVDSALTLCSSRAGRASDLPVGGTRALRPAATLGMTGAFDGFAVRVAMRPAFASRVAVGTWTWNRSQFVLGLITLSAGLVIVSLLQLHRERQLARVKSELVSGVSHELADAARADPHVRRDAAAWLGAQRRRATAVGCDHRPGGASARASRREHPAVLAGPSVRRRGVARVAGADGRWSMRSWRASRRSRARAA